MNWQTAQTPCAPSETDTEVQIMECEACIGPLVVYTGSYVVWQTCPSCEQSKLVAWSSCTAEALILGCARTDEMSIALWSFDG